MPLIKCPEYSNKISDKATSCPKCGIIIRHFSTHCEKGNWIIVSIIRIEGRLRSKERRHKPDGSTSPIEDSLWRKAMSDKFAEGANTGRQSRIYCQRVENNAFHLYLIQAIL